MPDKGKITIMLSDRGFDPVKSGREIPSESYSVTTALDTVAAGWTAVMPWDPGVDYQLDQLTKPFSFAESVVYVDGEQVSRGRLYQMQPSRSEGGRRQRTLYCFSYAVDIIDCVWNRPFQFFNQSFYQIAENQAETYEVGISLDEAAATEANRIISKVEAGITDNMFDRLSEIAKQQGLLLSSDKDGNLFVIKYNTTKTSVGTIRESEEFSTGSLDSTEFSADFDGRKLFARYAAIKSNRNQFQQFAVIQNDEFVPGKRTQRFEANSKARGSLLESAKWAASKGLADALTIDFPVRGWRAPIGDKLWKAGDIVTVDSETMSLKNVDMLIRKVKYKFDSQKGAHSVLSLVPPQVYSGEEIPLNIFKS